MKKKKKYKAGRMGARVGKKMTFSFYNMFGDGKERARKGGCRCQRGRFQNAKFPLEPVAYSMLSE